VFYPPTAISDGLFGNKPVGTDMSIGPKQLFRPMMTGWMVFVVAMAVLVPVILGVTGGQAASGQSFFGLTAFPGGLGDSGPGLVFNCLLIGIGLLFAGFAQGLVYWTIVSLGLLIVRSASIDGQKCQQSASDDRENAPPEP
jgi:hypothetical protein